MKKDFIMMWKRLREPLEKAFSFMQDFVLKDDFSEIRTSLFTAWFWWIVKKYTN